MEKIILADQGLDAADFIRLRVEAGFMRTPPEQAEKAIRNSLFCVTAVCEGETVGMGRLVGDGAMYWYLQEIIVHPRYQRRGIGTKIVNRLIRYVEEKGLPGSKMTIGLVAAQGKEPFYEKLGFVCIPDGVSGSGMKRYVQGQGESPCIAPKECET